MPFATVEAALAAIRAGGMVIVVDDEDRENEGDLTLAAEQVTPAAVNFMATHGKGLICVPLTAARCEALHLPPMVAENTAPLGTAFCVSVEARRGVGTGISAADRATTIRLLADPTATAADFTRPGHVFPLRARDGGVLTRAGQTEAAVDLARLAGLQPAGVICEVLTPDGAMARLPDLEAFAQTHALPLLTVQALIEYRLKREQLVSQVAETALPTAAGPFTARLYQSRVDGKHHLALTLGRPQPELPTLVRVHSECLTGDVFGSLRCDCGA
ncbi:MAG: 3,4-dihydroxy-2-butanone-4-phosphate synthase, partial [Candidatus Methylomirabilales bacterium]